MKKYFVILFLLQKFLGECEKGCLKCNLKTKECLICDIMKSYKFEKGSCIIKKTVNCQIQNLSGECLKCGINFKLDPTTKKCIEIEKQKLIKNCIYYNENNNCIFCEPYFYLNRNICEEIKKDIKNCQYYKNESECLICFEDFSLSPNHDSCIENYLLYKLEGCRLVTNFLCKKCIKNYIKDHFIKSKQFFDFYQNDQNLILLDMYDFLANTKKFEYVDICVPNPIELCVKYEDINFRKCVECAPGSYLEDYECFEYFKYFKNNCIEYEDVELKKEMTCLKCDKFYYLKNNHCLAVKLIDNCEDYDYNFESKCLKCKEDYFLINNKECILRKKSFGNLINFCKVKNLFIDNCAECDEKYFLSGDKEKCFLKNANCLLHENINNFEKNPSCLKCENKYFLNNKQCELGKIENCEEYEKNSENCVKCENGFYLSESSCKKSLNINSCKIWHPTLFSYCAECLEKHLKFDLKNFCQENPVIANCLEYHSSKILGCKKCEFGYFPNNTYCKKIEISNCAVKNTDNHFCQICSENYALSPINECFSPFDFFLQTCEKTSISNQPFFPVKINQVFCEVCKENFYPFNMKNFFICLKNNALQFEDIYHINNCLKYDINKKCVLCNEGYFLLKNADGEITCEIDCKNKDNFSYQKISLKKNELFFQIDSVRICVEKSDCVLFVPDISQNPENIICVKCDDNAMAFTDFGISRYSNLSLFSNEIIESPFDYHTEVLCKRKIENPIPFCELHVEQNNEVQCIKCENGYTGEISEKGMIKNCVFLEKCDERKFYNLPWIFEKINSCSKCSKNEEIPFLAINTEMVGNPVLKGYKRFNLFSLDWTGVEDPLQITQNCYQPFSDNFGYNELNKNLFQLPDNCGFGVINLSHSDGNCLDNKSQNLDNLALFCAACRPGFKSTQNDIFQFIVINCEPIQYCENSVWFNLCSECEEGFTYPYRFNKIDFGSCSVFFDKNCFAFDEIRNECIVCKKGFFLNPDKVCKERVPFKCESGFFSDDIKINFDNLNWGLFINSFGVGCNKCEEGYSAVQKSVSDLMTCFPFSQEDLKKENNFGILNCKNYFFADQTIKCNTCSNGYILNQNKNRCFEKKSGFENCSIAEDVGKCKICEEAFFLKNFGCVRGETPNCLLYNNDINNSELKCKKCENSFYLSSSGSCLEGEIKYCEIYKDFNPSSCLKCQKNYFILPGTIKDTCLLIESSLNCDEVRIDFKNEEFILSCTKCSFNNFSLLQISDNLQIISSSCVDYTHIDFCEQYSIIKNNNNSLDLLCKNCIQDFYLKNSRCVKRTNLIKNCKRYKQDEEKCEKCTEGYFFYNAKSYCKRNPRGIEHCINYQNQQICIDCETSHFLFENRCYGIEEIDQILNCDLYYDQYTCKSCFPGFVLENNLCVETDIKNCEKFENPLSCEICEFGYDRVSSVSGFICQKIIKNFCLVLALINNQYQCVQCNVGYILDEQNNCVSLTNPIPFCLIQISEKKCSLCEKDYILSINENSCFKPNFYSLDPFCENFEEIEARCVYCNPGYFFDVIDDTPICKKCLNGNSFEEGCYHCDQFDCFICITGFFMNDQGLCVKNDAKTNLLNDTSQYSNQNIFFMFFFILYYF